MKIQPLESRLLEIADQLLEKSRNGKVNWQTVGGEPANYYVHFGDETSFIVCFQSSDFAATFTSISLKIRSMVAVRLRAEEGQPNFAKFKDLFDEAHRAATGWDAAIRRIQKLINSGEPLGEPPGNIPLD